MINGKKIAAIVQARQGSSRLPGKATIDICGKPALQRVVERLRQAKTLDDVIVATTINEADDAIVKLCEHLKCNYYRGDEEDVLERVWETTRMYEVDVIVEITADCPLIDYNHVNHLVKLFCEGEYDHVSNVIERTFPRGYDIRVFSREALERTNAEVDNPIDRQHVSTWQYLNPRGKQNYRCLNWPAPPGQNRPDIEVTLDTPEDLELIRWIFGFEAQGYSVDLTCQNVINLLDTYPHMLEKVKRIKRKDYFAELEQAYAALNHIETAILNGSGNGKEPVGILGALMPKKKGEKGSEKKNGSEVQRLSNRGRKPRSAGRSAGKPKSK